MNSPYYSVRKVHAERVFKTPRFAVRRLARRQRASLVLDPRTKKPTHLITGADFAKHPGLTCDGCHWGSGMTLIQPLVQ